jgi:hypothetical protein
MYMPQVTIPVFDIVTSKVLASSNYSPIGITVITLETLNQGANV